MIVWSLFFCSLVLLARELRPYIRPVSQSQSLIDEWNRVQAGLVRVEESLVSGLALSENDWKRFDVYPPLWRKAFVDPIRLLRSQGYAVLPTLKRSRGLLRFFIELFSQSQTRVAPARAQAWVCFSLVPVVSLTFYFLLPSIRQELEVWIVMTGAALVLGVLAFAWVERLIDRAVWCEARTLGREGLFLFLTLPEKLTALVHSGVAVESAWAEVMRDFPPELLHEEIVAFWGESDESKFRLIEHKAIVRLKMGLHHSILAGTPVTEGIESWAMEQRVRVENEMRKRLETLPNQCLKPLFLCTAPGILLLVFAGIFLELQSQLGGEF